MFTNSRTCKILYVHVLFPVGRTFLYLFDISQVFAFRDSFSTRFVPPQNDLIIIVGNLLMVNFVRLLLTQQCLFNPKKLFFKKMPLSLQITTGMRKVSSKNKKNLIKGPEDRILVWPLCFLKYLPDLFWQDEYSKTYPSHVKFHIKHIRNTSEQQYLQGG